MDSVLSPEHFKLLINISSPFCLYMPNKEKALALSPYIMKYIYSDSLSLLKFKTKFKALKT